MPQIEGMDPQPPDLDRNIRFLPVNATYMVVLCLALASGWVALNAVAAPGDSSPTNGEPARVETGRDTRSAATGATAAEPSLDVESLKQRLRDTDAIGVFSKIALRNQMDDLIAQFRAHHARGRESDIASLRPPYNMLVLKVLALVQDGDPGLARTIAGSREALWRTLADPQKFKLIADTPQSLSTDPTTRQFSNLPGDLS